MYKRTPQRSRNISVTSASLDHSPAGVEGEEEEDDEYYTQDGQYHNAHHQIHGLEWSLDLVRVVRYGCGLVKEVACSPTDFLTIHLCMCM